MVDPRILSVGDILTWRGGAEYGIRGRILRSLGYMDKQVGPGIMFEVVLIDTGRTCRVIGSTSEFFVTFKEDHRNMNWEVERVPTWWEIWS
ncbi:MAG: hypothetical protein ACXABY_03735 [Candidatus Thorarchaeota archaeon]|jgi:hypothetical protein